MSYRVLLVSAVLSCPVTSACSKAQAAPGVAVGTTLEFVRFADGSRASGGEVIAVEGSKAQIRTKARGDIWVDFSKATTWK